jgi:hypothetical protein
MYVVFFLQCQKIPINSQVILKRAETIVVIIIFKSVLLCYRYTNTVSYHSLYMNMNQVPGDCYLCFDANKGKIICVPLLYSTFNDCRIFTSKGLSWSWSHGSWIYNYLCNQCLSLLMLWLPIMLRQGVLDTTFCNKDCQWLVADWWLSLGTLVSSTNKTDWLDTTEILLKVALNTITLSHNSVMKNVVTLSSHKGQSFYDSRL